VIKLPFWSTLEAANSVLVAGMGGGFDVYSGIPLYFALRSAGKQVHLANLSFSDLQPHLGEHLSPTLAKVDVSYPDLPHTNYFPEKRLSEWFRAQALDVPVYTFYRTGVRPLKDNYERLVRHLEIDTVILVDGGTDALMRGDEQNLGTPADDSASLAALESLQVPRKLLVCFGFGMDAHSGVSHAHFLEALADITRDGGYLGAFSLTSDMPEAKCFCDAVEYACSRTAGKESIFCTCVAAAIKGHFGDHHPTPRTEGSELFINPLMPIYWCMNADAVIRRHLYLDQIRETKTFLELKDAVAAYEKSRERIRPRRPLPM
jgi:hypothetical protein